MRPTRAHDGNALADMVDGALDDAQPGVSACAVEQVLSPIVAARAAAGLPTHPVGTPNRARFVAIGGGGLLAILVPEASS